MFCLVMILSPTFPNTYQCSGHLRLFFLSVYILVSVSHHLPKFWEPSGYIFLFAYFLVRIIILKNTINKTDQKDRH